MKYDRVIRKTGKLPAEKRGVQFAQKVIYDAQNRYEMLLTENASESNVFQGLLATAANMR